MFNGIRLKRIITLKTTTASDEKQATFRVLSEHLRELEERLHLHRPALLILSSQEIEGILMHYAADEHGYEVTIESKG